MLEILAVIGVIGFVVYQQLCGQSLRGKRVVLLPVILTVVGFTDLTGKGHHLTPADIVCLTVGAVGSVAIGLGFGGIMRLESRGGVLWARMPVYGLWLWAALLGWRGAVYVLAGVMHAPLAASSTTLLFTLGLNRLAQAAVVVPRAFAAGIPFAPEKDGRTFLADVFAQGRSDGPSGTDPNADRWVGRNADRRDGRRDDRRSGRRADRWDRR